NNCLLTNNSTVGNGGGAAYCTLNNCALSGNSATNGGGVYISYNDTLNNCTLANNSAINGGGVYSFTNGQLNNCIVYFHSAANGSNFFTPNTMSTFFYHCCTAPMFIGGDNITDDPLFVDLAGGNLRLQPQSPCIDAGANYLVPPGPDLDGNPRIVGDNVD